MNKDKQLKPKKKKGALKFLLAVVIFYILVGLFKPQMVCQAFLKTIWLLVKLIPLLIVVLLAMIIINLLIDSPKFRKCLQARGWQAWFWACLGGVLVSGPPYILYPLLAELKKHGMSDSFLAVFLYNRNVKIPFLPVMVYYFGFSFTVIVSVLIIVFSFLNGWLVEKLVAEQGE